MARTCQADPGPSFLIPKMSGGKQRQSQRRHHGSTWLPFGTVRVPGEGQSRAFSPVRPRGLGVPALCRRHLSRAAVQTCLRPAYTFSRLKRQTLDIVWEIPNASRFHREARRGEVPPGRPQAEASRAGWGERREENMTTLYILFVRLAGDSRAASEFRDFENTNRNSLKKCDVSMDESPA
jgi:hypothetical protein